MDMIDEGRDRRIPRVLDSLVSVLDLDGIRQSRRGGFDDGAPEICDRPASRYSLKDRSLYRWRSSWLVSKR